MQLAIHSPYARTCKRLNYCGMRVIPRSFFFLACIFSFQVPVVAARSGVLRGNACHRPTAIASCLFFFKKHVKVPDLGLPSICNASTARKPLGGLLTCGGRRAQSAWRRRVTNKQTAATVCLFRYVDHTFV